MLSQHKLKPTLMWKWTNWTTVFANLLFWRLTEELFIFEMIFSQVDQRYLWECLRSCAPKRTWFSTSSSDTRQSVAQIQTFYTAVCYTFWHQSGKTSLSNDIILLNDCLLIQIMYVDVETDWCVLWNPYCFRLVLSLFCHYIHVHTVRVVLNTYTHP